MRPADIALELRSRLRSLRFSPPVTHVYDPLTYAWGPHEQYLRRWGEGPREILLLGMNPGPWGMAQTGVPFGEVRLARDWLGLDAPLSRPDSEHPKRPVLGWACPRSEVSGARLWGWARARFGAPERFFERFFVLNYCPLLFLEQSGKNRTPDKLHGEERTPLLAACDEALRRFAGYYRPERVLGIGNFARDRAREALSSANLAIDVLPHPSPANPAANRGWAALADRALGFSP
ncbi:MAG TPA: single-stranded DNA-binding protein [Elusimicrobia bacterium]|nr:single-stranded DNA-binding protein [Elusimicrobiota bacterium]